MMRNSSDKFNTLVHLEMIHVFLFLQYTIFFIDFYSSIVFLNFSMTLKKIYVLSNTIQYISL